MNKNLNRRQVSAAVASRETFSNSTGSLTGVSGPNVGGHLTGRLNTDERLRFLSDVQRGITYLVASYGTPIAWVCADGEVYRVAQKFSVTTSCHMGLLYTL